MIASDAVTYRVNGPVATVTLDRPPYNHVNLAVVTALAATLEALDHDKHCRAVVLTTASKVFCGGADLASPDGLLSGGEAGLAPFYVQAARLFGTRKPIIAAVQGAAVGAGLGLALIADFRVATPECQSACKRNPRSASNRDPLGDGTQLVRIGDSRDACGAGRA